MKQFRRTWMGTKSIIVQAIAGGIDTGIQNYLIYYGGILLLGEYLGYVYAACIGGFFNVVLCFVLKLKFVYGNNGQLGNTIRAYSTLRLWLALWGILITYGPHFAFGVAFYITSTSSLLFSIAVLVWKSPAIFAVPK